MTAVGDEARASVATPQGSGGRGPTKSFARSAMTGSAWAIGQVVFSKCLSLGGTVITSWLLLPEDLGLASLTLAAIVFPAFLRPNVLTDILIRSVESCESLARAARRLTLISTVFTLLLTVAIAPLVATLYGEQALLWLLPVAGLRVIASAIGIGALARLRLEFRFKEIASGAALETIVTHTSTIAMAAAGLGPFAILLGQSLGIGAAGLRYNAIARPLAPRGAEEPMRKLLAPFFLLNAAQWIHTLTIVSATLCLGLVVDSTGVGLFSFATALSAQMNMLLAYNVGLVLQPIFGHLQADPHRQTAGFLRACAGIAAIAAPAYLAQAAVARPMLELIFAPQWMPSLRALELLFVAQFFAFATGPAMSLLKAQARYRTLVVWQAAQVVVVIALMLALSRRFGLEGAAAAVLLQHLVFGPVGVHLATRSGAVPLRGIAALFVVPFALAAVVFTPLWFATSALSTGPVASIGVLVLTPLVGGGVYLLLLRRVQPDVSSELIGLLGTVRSRIAGRRRPTDAGQPR